MIQNEAVDSEKLLSVWPQTLHLKNWEPQKYRWESLKTTQLRYIAMKQWAFIVFQKRSQKVMSALVKHGNVLRW